MNQKKEIAIFNRAKARTAKYAATCAMFLLFILPAFSQPALNWAVTINGSQSAWDESRLLYVDASGNSYFGSYSSTITGGNDVTIYKYNSSGTMVWAANQDGAATGNIDWANGLIVDASGNIYISGYNTDFSGTAVIVSFNSSGTFRWISHLSTVFNDESFSIATDGTFIYACAHTFIWTGHFNDDYQTIKVDCATGTTQAGWPQTYNSVYNNQDWPTSITTTNGNVYVTGTCNNGSNRDWMTIGYDANGNILAGWPQIYNGAGNGDDVPAQILVNAAGNLVITGFCTGAVTNWDMCTIMYTPGGATVAGWPQTYNGTANGWDGAGNTNNHSQMRCMTTDASNNVYVCGWVQNTGTNYDIITTKYNSSGVVQAGWPKIYDQAGQNDIGRGITMDAGTDVFITGYTTNGGGGQDIVTIQYDASGVVQGGWPMIWNGPANQADEGMAISVVGQCVWVTGNAGNGATDMATLNYCNITVLPVEFLSFDATYDQNSDAVDLVWETASEINNAYFLVERSKDGNNWETVEKIKGAGNSTKTLRYNARDNNPYPGLSYYRLQQVDHNGKGSYSKMDDVISGAGFGFSAFPNPCKGKFELAINGKELNEDAEIFVYDVLGNVIFQTTIAAPQINDKPAPISIPIDLGNARGIYFYKVVCNNKTLLSGKVISQ
jgi:hypothetical protein